MARAFFAIDPVLVTKATPADRRGTRGSGRQFEWRIHHVRGRAPENQPGSEGAMGEAEDSPPEAHDLCGGQEADRGGAESAVGEGEESSVNCGASLGQYRSASPFA